MTLVEARAQGAETGSRAARRWTTDPRVGAAAVTVLAVVAAVHAVAVAPHYHVGSFDDDGHYLALARAFEHGRGYVDTSAPGAPVETLYPPGYPLVLVPLLWLSGGALWPARVLSAVAFVACVPLADLVLRRHRLAAAPRLLALTLFALSPVAATFATMVMPETLFLLVLLLVLLALPGWEAGGRVRTWGGAVVAFGTPYLLLLKAAGLPFVAALILWLGLRRRLRHAAAVVAATVLFVGPVFVARALSGQLVGSRYANEYSHHTSLLAAFGSGAGRYIDTAIPATLLQWFSVNLMHHGPVVDAALLVFRYTAAALVVIGFVAWQRRRRDVTALIVPLYLLETLPYPYVNERRVVLLLPLVLAWWVLGGAAVVAALRRARLPRALRLPGAVRRPVVAGVAAVPALALVAGVAAQFPRNYLMREPDQSSRPATAGYTAALREVTPAGWSVATSYRWTMALFTGRTATNAPFFRLPCSSADARLADRAHALLRQDRAATVLVAALNRPHRIDSPCLLAALATVPWAVPVYTGGDSSTVFVLLGAGTPRARESVLADVAGPVDAVVPLDRPARAVEVSAQVRAAAGVPRVWLQVRSHGAWVTVASARAGRGAVLVHGRLDAVRPVDAVRVVGPAGLTVRHVVVLGGH